MLGLVSVLLSMSEPHKVSSISYISQYGAMDGIGTSPQKPHKKCMTPILHYVATSSYLRRFEADKIPHRSCPQAPQNGEKGSFYVSQRFL